MSERPLVVHKFGGTSLGDAERIVRAARLMAGAARRHRVVGVASAMGGVTDVLLRAAHEAKVAAIWLSRRLTGLSGREVGAAFGVRQARVSNVLGDVRSGRWRALRPALDELEKGLLAENE